jgi:diguanylate cyclase (GGDEF)-like protein
MSASPVRSARILVVDDRPEIHDDLRKLLAAESEPSGLRSELASLLRTADELLPKASVRFEVDSAQRGAEALDMVRAAEAEGRPYALAFVDKRLNSGWDGLETLERILPVAPDMQVVICTAYSEGLSSEVRSRLGQSGDLLVLRKPFEGIEAVQMALVLAEKWHLARESARKRAELEARTGELEREIARRARAEEKLVHDALHDALTDLPNRALIADRIDHCLRIARRDPTYGFALLLLGLDDFTVVNDSLGHDAGDRVLVQCAERILTCTRQTDCASRNLESAAARLGGDEFLVLLDGLRSRDDATYVAQRIRASLGQPLTIDGHELRPSASLGIAYGTTDYEDASAIIRDADTALHRAKASDDTSICVFAPQLRRDALARLRVESELRQAIQRDQLFLQYQPIVRLSDLEIQGLEALVRWDHPTQGVIPPSEFVPLAEETGLILPLGEWVLRTACAQAVDWRKRIPAAAQIFMSVNFSSKQLGAPDFVHELLAILDESGLERRLLNVEVTESVLMQTTGPSAKNVQRLNEAGLELHLDDFGTGFSSLAYLHDLPVAAIKIDRSFLRGLDGGRSSVATIKAVIEMARSRGIKTVAEGIETAEQLALLRELGCDLGQGYHFARPLDVPAVERMLLASSARAA